MTTGTQQVTIRLRIQVRRVSDGLTRTYEDGTGFTGDTRSDAMENANYWWTDGNGGCDCNRSLYFNRAADEPEEDIPCSDDLFRVRVVDADSGDVIVDEFEDVTPDSADSPE